MRTSLTITGEIEEIRKDALILKDGTTIWDKDNISGLPYMLGKTIKLTITAVEENKETTRIKNQITFTRIIDNVNPYGFKTRPDKKDFYELQLFYNISGAINSQQLKFHPFEIDDYIEIKLTLL